MINHQAYWLIDWSFDPEDLCLVTLCVKKEKSLSVYFLTVDENPLLITDYWLLITNYWLLCMNEVGALIVFVPRWFLTLMHVLNLLCLFQINQENTQYLLIIDLLLIFDNGLSVKRPITYYELSIYRLY